MKSLIWLRKKVIKSNKSMVLQVILPLGFAFLYKHIYEIQGTLTNSMKVNLLGICLALALSLSVGKSNQYYCFRRKGKKYFKNFAFKWC